MKIITRSLKFKKKFKGKLIGEYKCILLLNNRGRINKKKLEIINMPLTTIPNSRWRRGVLLMPNHIGIWKIKT